MGLRQLNGREIQGQSGTTPFCGQLYFLFTSAQDSHPSGNHQHHSIEMQHPFFNLQSNARVMHQYCKSNAPLCVFSNTPSTLPLSLDSGHTGLMCFGESDD